MRLALMLSVAALPVFADVNSVIDTHILPAYARLATETATLAGAAAADCTSDAVQPTYHSAYDAWISISHIQFGPIEDLGLNLAMSFWPDPKDNTGKALARLSREVDLSVEDPEEFQEVSVAAQGFTALERLLYEPQTNPEYACQLIRAISTGLARKAGRIHAAWPVFEDLMRRADNNRFQSNEDVQRALYTALSTGLEFLHDQRLGRPLGTYDHPRPRRTEARRSERSLRHVVLSLTALEALATTMSQDDLPKTSAAFASARQRAESLDDPALASVAFPAGRFRVEALQQAVRSIQNAVIEEIAEPLGISAGFNALDGD